MDKQWRKPRIQFLKAGVAQMQRAFRYPPESIPGDGIHHFDCRGPKAAPRAMQKTEAPARNPQRAERRADCKYFPICLNDISQVSLASPIRQRLSGVAWRVRQVFRFPT